MGIKTVTAKIQNNYIGTIAGAGLAYWASKKYMGVTGIWKTVGVVVLGAVVGAYAQGMISAKSSTPKASTIK
jgi:hypothetical protein